MPKHEENATEHIRIRPTTKAMLDELRAGRGERYDSIIERLVKSFKASHKKN